MLYFFKFAEWYFLTFARKQRMVVFLVIGQCWWFFFQRLYCQVPSTPFVTVPSTPPEMFHTVPETPGHQSVTKSSPNQHRLQSLNVSIKLLKHQMTEALNKQDQESFKEIDARLHQEEKRKLEQIPTQLQFEVSRDDI